jgi:hypothetical protein
MKEILGFMKQLSFDDWTVLTMCFVFLLDFLYMIYVDERISLRYIFHKVLERIVQTVKLSNEDITDNKTSTKLSSYATI